jgi:pimeloyl-ACP methyl ester carboxylesterase
MAVTKTADLGPGPAGEPTHRHADLDGVRIHYVEAGEGPLVLLLHGFPTFWYDWRHLIPRLVAAGYRVVAPDQRGYNLSAKPKGLRAYRVEALFGDMSKLIRHLGGGKARVVAHDWGGGIGWYLAMQRPEQVERLVIIDSPHPAIFAARLFKFPQLLRSWYMFAFVIPLLPELLLSAFGFFGARKLMRAMVLRPEGLTDVDLDRQVEAWSVPGALNRMITWYRALILGGPKRVAPLVARTEVPVLILWGMKDTALGHEMAQPDPELVPNAEVEKFSEGGHFLHLDEPDAIADRITGFFGR